MKTISNEVKRFVLLLSGVLAPSFVLHYLLQVYYLSSGSNMLITSYVVNLLMALAVFLILIFIQEKYKENLGFVFMGGSMFKFLIFFLIFQPVFKADGNMSKVEFITFFIPYAICLIIETSWLVKKLNA